MFSVWTLLLEDTSPQGDIMTRCAVIYVCEGNQAQPPLLNYFEKAAWT